VAASTTVPTRSPSRPLGCWLVSSKLCGRFREAKRGRLNPFVLTISPQDTFEQWKSSTGHCENMMNGNLKTIGIGYAKGGPYGHYWTQSFDN